MKKKQSKLIIFISLLIILFFVFLYFILRPYSYNVVYNYNDYKITEEFNKQTQIYTFMISKDDLEYPFQIESKYIHNKELIKDIKEYKNDSEFCMLPLSDYFDFSPLCSSEKIIYNYNVSSVDIKDFKYKTLKKDNIKYKDITINDYNDNNYLVYNYKGFYFLSNKENKNIELFKNDKYTIDLVYELNNKILIADYNQEHYFNKFYVISMTTGELEEIKSDFNISFNSKFLGYFKNKIYLLDLKEKKEYVIDIKKSSVEETEYIIVEQGKLVNTTFENINDNDISFNDVNKFHYTIKNEKLYQVIDEREVLLSNMKVNKIITVVNDSVYYLSNENLYVYNNRIGENLILSNFEWNFNNTNVFYVSK